MTSRYNRDMISRWFLKQYLNNISQLQLICVILCSFVWCNIQHTCVLYFVNLTRCLIAINLLASKSILLKHVMFSILLFVNFHTFYNCQILCLMMKILVSFIYLNAAHVAMFYIQLINLSILLTKLTKTFPLYCKICLLRYTEVLAADEIP